MPFVFLYSSLEVQSRRESELPVRAPIICVGRPGDDISRIHASEVERIDVNSRIIPVRRIQDVDDVHANFEVLHFVDSDALHKVHIELDVPWAFDPGSAEAADRSGSRIGKNDVVVAIRKSPICKQRLQILVWNRYQIWSDFALER